MKPFMAVEAMIGTRTDARIVIVVVVLVKKGGMAKLLRLLAPRPQWRDEKVEARRRLAVQILSFATRLLKWK